VLVKPVCQIWIDLGMAYPVWLARRVRSGFRSLGFSIRRIQADREGVGSNSLVWSSFPAFLQTLREVAPSHPSLNLEQVAKYSQSQLGQDFVAVWLFGTNGFFVEFGAADGKHLSNSYLLEKVGWKGCLAEPSRGFHAALAQNRPSTPLEKRCVWSKSGEQLEFVETFVGELSTVRAFEDTDDHDRSDSTRYPVQTIAFEEFLASQDAPRVIQFLSIDTEGSELEILSSLDFNQRRFGFIAVEHNYTKNRGPIHDLLAGHGYVRFGERFSLFDDWYIHPEVLAGR